MPNRRVERGAALGGWSLVRDLEIVCAMVSERKTTAAAQSLGMSQSAVSRAVAAIERRHGKPLFHRESGRLQPTAEALDLYRKGTTALAVLAELRGMPVAESPERLMVTAPPTILQWFLVPIVGEFVRRHPNVTVSVHVAGVEDPTGAVAEGRAVVGVTDATFIHPGVVAEPLIDTDLVCVMPAGHHLAGKPWIGPDDLDEEDYVTINPRHPLRAALDQVFLNAGVRPRTVAETDLAMAAVELIRHGLGVSILNPFPICLRGLGDLVVRPFAPRLTLRSNIMLPANIPLPVAAKRFVDLVKEHGRRAASELAVAR